MNFNSMVHHLKYSFMKRLDQGHLHPKLEIIGLTVPAGKRTRPAYKVGGEHSRKNPFEQLVNSHLDIYTPHHLKHAVDDGHKVLRRRGDRVLQRLKPPPPQAGDCPVAPLGQERV